MPLRNLLGLTIVFLLSAFPALGEETNGDWQEFAYEHCLSYLVGDGVVSQDLLAEFRPASQDEAKVVGQRFKVISGTGNTFRSIGGKLIETKTQINVRDGLFTEVFVKGDLKAEADFVIVAHEPGTCTVGVPGGSGKAAVFSENDRMFDQRDDGRLYSEADTTAFFLMNADFESIRLFPSRQKMGSAFGSGYFGFLSYISGMDNTKRKGRVTFATGQSGSSSSVSVYSFFVRQS